MPKDKVKINVKDRLEENVLDLSLSEIEHIPVKDIAAVRRATVLDLSSNNIKFLPKNFGSSLVHLSRLDLSKNQLKFLTEDFCNLVNLINLNLYENQLENLPISFGKLQKLRFLDLKGNPLQPALQKIVGPCLTTKDCIDAAKNVVPFMRDLEVTFRAEQEKKEEAEKKRLEEEAQAAREQARLAKKAARKERVMRERQEKAESEKHVENPKPVVSETKKAFKEVDFKSEKSASNSRNLLSFLKTLIFGMILFSAIFVLFLKFLPDPSNRVLSLLSQQQQEVLRYAFKKIDGSIVGLFQKVLNFYKM